MIIKIRPVGAELFQYGRTDRRTDVTKLIVAILWTRLKVVHDLLARALNCKQNYTQDSINRGREEQSVCGAVDLSLKFTHSVIYQNYTLAYMKRLIYRSHTTCFEIKVGGFDENISSGCLVL